MAIKDPKAPSDGLLPGYMRCPACAQQVVAAADSCPFCSASLAHAARPKGVGTYVPGVNAYREVKTPSWYWPGYYVASAVYLVNGCFRIMMALGIGSGKGRLQADPLSIGTGLLTLVVAILFLIKLPFIREHARWFAWGCVCFDAITLLVAPLAIALSPAFGIGLVILALADLGASWFMIVNSDMYES